jgi:hypothetical protein
MPRVNRVLFDGSTAIPSGVIPDVSLYKLTGDHSRKRPIDRAFET